MDNEGCKQCLFILALDKAGIISLPKNGIVFYCCVEPLAIDIESRRFMKCRHFAKHPINPGVNK